jgi:hypothetical protein
MRIAILSFCFVLCAASIEANAASGRGRLCTTPDGGKFCASSCKYCASQKGKCGGDCGRHVKHGPR